jgi:hypothetical protein
MPLPDEWFPLVAEAVRARMLEDAAEHPRGVLVENDDERDDDEGPGPGMASDAQPRGRAREA